ncbi:MAG: hypothetical protein AAFN70_18860, partial [Planctomycetota bacterium]
SPDSAPPTDAEVAATDPQRPQMREYWEQYFVGETPSGFRHVIVQPLSNRVDGRVEIQSVDQLTLNVGTLRRTQRLSQTIRQGAERSLERFTATLDSGPMRTEYDGKVQFGKLVVNQQFGPENSNSYKAPWPSGAAGTLGVQQELWDRPMTLGEERSIQCLQPIIFQPSTVTLKAIGPAPVVFPGSDEFVSLLEIQSTVTIHANPEMESQRPSL